MVNAQQRKTLRARAHKLEPLVIIGGKGLSGEVLAEIERALKAHELVKIRAPGLDRGQRQSVYSEICSRAEADPIQQVGKVFVIFRKNDD